MKHKNLKGALRTVTIALALLATSPFFGQSARAGIFTLVGGSAPRYSHTATLLPDGTVLAAGGFDGNGSEVINSMQLYYPTIGGWSFGTGPMHYLRASHTATLLLNGKVLIAGGANGGGVLDTVEIYDPATGTCTLVHSMNTPRRSHTATLLSNGNVLVIGGQDGAFNRLASAEIYDPVAGTWTLTSPSMHVARVGHTATLLSSGKVLVAGGNDNSGDPVSSAEAYDPNAGTWTLTTSTMTTERSDHSATLLYTGKVLVQ